MKYCFFILVFCTVFFSANAQKNQQQYNTTEDSTAQKSNVFKLFEGDKITWKNYCLFFNEVVSDSRCPSDVTCVWAGEAKVKVSIEKNGELLETKILTLPNSSADQKKAFELGDQSIQVIKLAPYPTSENKKDLDYFLEIILRLD